MTRRSKKWVLKEGADPEKVSRVRSQLNGLSEPLARSLVLRGVQSLEDARSFFRAGMEDLLDPLLMRDMDLAAKRLARAIRTNERVLVYGDYDVDGITSTTLLTHFLREKGVPAAFFIPDRIRHGYGLCTRGLDHALEARATLVIALDCGVTAVQEALYAKNLGIDLVVCDHHTAPEVLPDAVAVLDPKRADCAYPFKELCGCGVTFKLVQATLSELGEDPAAASCYLDLVALATASDVVPLTGENRVLVREGLEVLRRRERLGLVALAAAARVDLAQCSTRMILFSLAPRMNAAGRLGDARRAVQLLLSEDPVDADTRARHLDRLNQDRRTLEQATVEEAIRQAESFRDRSPDSALVLYQPEWHVGVLGIVASRLVDRYARPAILLGAVGDSAKGSARSVAGINIYDALAACSSHLDTFGGHDYAAGLTIQPDRIDAFRADLVRAVDQSWNDEFANPPLRLDARLGLGDINDRFWAVLRQFEPFGPLNDQPIFHSVGLEVLSEPGLVGKEGRHLKFRVREAGSSLPAIEVIGFGLGDDLPTVLSSRRTGQPIELAHSVTENVWNGTRTIQLSAEAIRPHEPVA